MFRAASATEDRSLRYARQWRALPRAVLASGPFPVPRQAKDEGLPDFLRGIGRRLPSGPQGLSHAARVLFNLSKNGQSDLQASTGLRATRFRRFAGRHTIEERFQLQCQWLTLGNRQLFERDLVIRAD